MLLLLQICFLVSYERDLCCLFLTIIKKMLLKHLTLDDLPNFDHPYFEQMVC